jgi:hypothetical protein
MNDGNVQEKMRQQVNTEVMEMLKTINSDETPIYKGFAKFDYTTENDYELNAFQNEGMFYY